MKLIEVFKKSVYSPEFYRELQSKPLSFSIKYFYSLVLVFSIILTVLVSAQLIPAGSDFIKRIGPQLLSIYPDDLIITIKNGEVSVNTHEPLYLILPEAAKWESEDKYATDAPKHLLVIDTQNPAALDNFESYSTLVLATKNKIAAGSPDNLRVITLDKNVNFTVTKHTVSIFLNKLSGLSGWLSPIIVFGAFVFFTAFFSTKLIYLFLAAILVWLLAKLKKFNLNYKQSYQAALHAFSLSLLIQVLSFLFLPSVLFLPTVIMLIVVWFNFPKNLPEKPVIPLEPPNALSI